MSTNYEVPHSVLISSPLSLPDFWVQIFFSALKQPQCVLPFE